MMRFYSDTEEATEIVWYPVPENRPFLPIPTVFVSWDWCEPNRPGDRTPGGVGLGEQLEAERTYPGRPLPLRTVFRGQYCGDPDQWLNGDGLPVVPPPLQIDGFPVCCGPAQIPFPSIYECSTLAKLSKALELQYTANVLARDYVDANLMPGVVWRHVSDNGASSFPGVLIGTCEDWTIVVVSGTTNGVQWFAQITSSLAMSNQFTPGGAAYRTSAFYAAGGANLARLVVQYATPNRPILMAGHSYGGALCNVAALTLCETEGYEEVWLASFGAPRSGDGAAATLLGRSVAGIISVINDLDPVPRTPPWANEAVMFLFPELPWSYWQQWADNPNRRGLSADGRLSANPTSYLSFGIYVWILTHLGQIDPAGAFEEHGSDFYADRLALLNCAGEPPMPPPPPGPMLWFKPESIQDLNDFDPIGSWPNEGYLDIPLVQGDPLNPCLKMSDFGWPMALCDFVSTMQLQEVISLDKEWAVFLVGAFYPLIQHSWLNGSVPACFLTLTSTQYRHDHGVDHYSMNSANPAGGLRVFGIRRNRDRITIMTTLGDRVFSALSTQLYGLQQFTPTCQYRRTLPPLIVDFDDCGLVEAKVYDYGIDDDQWQMEKDYFANKYAP